MSAFSGKGHGKGAMKVRREIKRSEAEARFAASEHEKDGRRKRAGETR